jgi:hypothetical protein
MKVTVGLKRRCKDCTEHAYGGYSRRCLVCGAYAIAVSDDDPPAVQRADLECSDVLWVEVQPQWIGQGRELSTAKLVDALQRSPQPRLLWDALRTSAVSLTVPLANPQDTIIYEDQRR